MIITIIIILRKVSQRDVARRRDDREGQAQDARAAAELQDALPAHPALLYTIIMIIMIMILLNILLIILMITLIVITIVLVLRIYLCIYIYIYIYI